MENKAYKIYPFILSNFSMNEAFRQALYFGNFDAHENKKNVFIFVSTEKSRNRGKDSIIIFVKTNRFDDPIPLEISHNGETRYFKYSLSDMEDNEQNTWVLGRAEVYIDVMSEVNRLIDEMTKQQTEEKSDKESIETKMTVVIKSKNNISVVVKSLENYLKNFNAPNDMMYELTSVENNGDLKVYTFSVIIENA